MPPWRPGSEDRDINHIYADVGVIRVPVMVGAVLCVLFRILDLIFFDDLLAFYHTSPAIGTAVFSLLACGAAARTGLIILDLGPGDFLLRFLI